MSIGFFKFEFAPNQLKVADKRLMIGPGDTSVKGDFSPSLRSPGGPVGPTAGVFNARLPKKKERKKERGEMVVLDLKFVPLRIDPRRRVPRKGSDGGHGQAERLLRS